MTNQNKLLVQGLQHFGKMHVTMNVSTNNYSKETEKKQSKNNYVHDQ